MGQYTMHFKYSKAQKILMWSLEGKSQLSPHEQLMWCWPIDFIDLTWSVLTDRSIVWPCWLGVNRVKTTLHHLAPLHFIFRPVAKKQHSLSCWCNLHRKGKTIMLFCTHMATGVCLVDVCMFRIRSEVKFINHQQTINHYTNQASQCNR